MSTAIACPHLVTPPALQTRHVFDAHLHMTDGLVQCSQCGAMYLAEMIDTARGRSLFRMSAVSPAWAEKTIASLSKGSCDIHRARNEVFSLQNSAQPLGLLLVMERGAFTAVVEAPAATAMPTASWRELPCDGALLHAVGC